MTRLFVLICSFWLFLAVIAAPLKQEAQGAGVERRSAKITPASFGHLAINLGVAGAATLATILGAETAFHILKMHHKAQTQRSQASLFLKKKNDYAKDNAKREEIALGLLLELADRQVRKVEGEGGKVQPFVVPKEIDESLESVFRAGEDGQSNLKAYERLKQGLAPLLEFEE
jgi:hypothetical protein